MTARIEALRLGLRAILDDFETGVSGHIESWRTYRRAMSSVPAPMAPVPASWRRAPKNLSAPSELANQFTYVLVVEAMLRSLDQIAGLRVPEEVKALVLEEFEARCEDGVAHRYERYSLADSEGWNQLASSRLLRLPLGLYVFNIAGIPRSNWLRCPTHEKVALAKFLAFQMHGFSPVFEVHLPRQEGRHVTEDEVDASHLLLARVAQMNPRMKGLYSSAWYIDPAVAAIQPRLAFLREFFLKNGGFVHRLGVTPSSIEDALRKSATRRKLYDERKYQPTAWARYWPRAAMLRWARLA